MSLLWWLLIGGVTVLFLVGGGVVAWRLVRLPPKNQVGESLESLAVHLRALQGDLAAVCACQVDAMERAHAREQSLQAVESRLEAMEQRLRQVIRRQEEQLHTGDPGETSYGAAIRLAHQGANVEQLVNTFGLARGEAELIAALHRAQNEQS